MYKTCHFRTISKPFDTVLLCYLALNEFFVVLFGELDLISVKIIILNHFCNIEQVLRLI